MKKLLILLMSFSLFMACNNDKPKYDRDDRNADYREKDDYRKDDNTKDEYSSDGWSEKDRSKFIRDCLSESGDDNPQAKKICSCILEKLEKKYASLSEGDRKGGEAEGKRMATQCLEEIGGSDRNDEDNDRTNEDNDRTDYDDGGGGDWTRKDENKFVSECADEAAKTVGETRANQYCSCMLQKAKKMYSSYSEADRKLAGMSKEQIQRMAADCNE
jgi:hypothetical protein